MTTTQRPRSSAVLTGATFADRRAARAARGELAPFPLRLVSLGISEIALPSAGSRGPGRRGQVYEVETFVDAQDQREVYRRVLPHGQLQRVQLYAEAEQTSEDLGVMRNPRIDRGTPDDIVVRLPAIDPAQRAAAALTMRADPITRMY